MKSLNKLSALVLVLIISAINAAAATITDERGLVYNILTEPTGDESGTCEVGDNKSYEKQPEVVIPESILVDEATYHVVGVGQSAFANNSSITKFDLSGCSQLQSIGRRAFDGCSYLTSVGDLGKCSQLQSIGH